MKKMSFCLAIVLLLSFCFGGCGQPQPNPKLDDLNLLCETLETEHYDLYANISEEEFQAEREKIAKQTPNMTDAEFYWSVRHLLSLVGDAHTTAYPSDYFMSVLPWNIKKFDEGWFILILDKTISPSTKWWSAPGRSSPTRPTPGCGRRHRMCWAGKRRWNIWTSWSPMSRSW